MKHKFDQVVNMLIETGMPRKVVTTLNEGKEYDHVFKRATGFLANGLSMFDPTRFDKLEIASKFNSWAFDSMKLGAVDLQRMHPLLSAKTANWSAGALSGETVRPSKPGPQPSFAKTAAKWVIHYMVDVAVEHGLSRSRHRTTLNEFSAIDAVRDALAREGHNTTFDTIEGYDKWCQDDANRESLNEFFPTEDF